MASDAALIDRIDRELPQTQCTQCGFAGCRPYAEAIAGGRAAINQCAPGGAAAIERLAAVTGRPVVALNPDHGREEPLRRALIDEARCIGCTLCIAACPVDAIVGGARSMHTVLADRCTGCRLCVAPCPVDCIALVDAGFAWTARHAEVARGHFVARQQRRELAARRRRDLRAPEPDQPAALCDTPRASAGTAEERMRATIDAALARARQRRARRGTGTP